METTPTLDEFPLKTYEKLRYRDTDRQGHVNNAVFATMCETGRVEALYYTEQPLAGEKCSFVIVNLTLDFLAEIKRPGRVEIGTRVAKIGRSSVTFEQGLFQNGKCVATARTVVVQLDEDTRSSHPLNAAAVAHLEGLIVGK